MKHVVKALLAKQNICMALKCLLDKRNHLTFFEKHQGRCFYLERTHDKPDLQMDVEHGKKIQGKHRVLHHMKIGKISSDFVKNS